MANCDSKGIFADILNDCEKQPVGGIEETIYMMNRKDISAVTYNSTNKNIVEAITLDAGKYAYIHKAFKKSANGGHEIVVTDNMPDHYKQKLSIVAWGIDGATVKALDNLSDLVVIVEMKNKGTSGNGAFHVLGLETGLHKSTDARTFNDNMGNRSIELSSLAGEESTVSSHVFFKTDYATTLGLISGLVEA